MGNEWPGWEEDTALAERHARIIRRRLVHRAGVKRMVDRWLEAYEIPQRTTPGDAESFLMTHAGAGIVESLGACLENLWQDAWVMGAGHAARLSREAAGDDAVAIKSENPVRCDAGHEHAGRFGAAGLLIRHREPGGKWHYLLQQRAGSPRGSWDVPGGSLHEHETPYDGAMREAREEIGRLPGDLMYHHRVIDHHGNWRFTYHVMDSPSRFMPALDGATPEETLDARWMTAREARQRQLHPGFAAVHHVVLGSDQDTLINSVMAPVTKARNPLRGHGADPAKLPPDPWAVIRGKLIRAGIPGPMAGVLASQFEQFEQGDAATAMQGILATLAGQIGPILEQARDGMLTAREAVDAINAVLDHESKALRIAVTEVSRASQEAAQQVYILGKVTEIRWVTADDARVCPKCTLNHDAGPIPLGDMFPTGLTTPPQHPNCRCAVVPVPVVDKPGGLWDIMKHLGEVSDNPWLKSARTPMLSATHNPLGPHGLWHTPDRHTGEAEALPDYIENIAHALIRGGMDEHEAIAMAIAAVKRWARGNLEWGRRRITPEVIRASREAVAQWEALRAVHD